jgi:hypothetical protein
MTTLVTAEQIAEVRRMVGEPTTATYSDDLLITYIEKYPHLDEYGEEPTTEDGEANSEWTPTYDLHAAAGDIWEEKAATVSGKFDFSADGGSYSPSQVYQQFMAQCRHHRARRMPSTARMVKSPPEERMDMSWIANLRDTD